MSESMTKDERAENSFGIRDRRLLRRTQYVTTLLTILMCFLLMNNVNKIQGNARIINYTGMVRGNTQRLIKEELTGHPDDRTMQQMDDILYSLKTGTGKYTVVKIEDASFQDALSTQSQAWDALKQEIQKYRLSSTERNTLYQMSEDYYVTADHTVSMIQNYAETIERNFTNLEISLSVVMSVDIMLLVGYYIVLSKATYHNKKLSDIVYVDSLTGLSNKRKCRERLSNTEPIPADTSVTCYMFDLNNLKKVNDESGHEYGDKLIHCFAEALLREALPHMFLGRFGGDEFIGVCVNTAEKDMDAFEERLTACCKTYEIDGTHRISYATGRASSKEFPGKNVQELMNAADERMYQNKRAMKANRI